MTTTTTDDDDDDDDDDTNTNTYANIDNNANTSADVVVDVDSIIGRLERVNIELDDDELELVSELGALTIDRLYSSNDADILFLLGKR